VPLLLPERPSSETLRELGPLLGSAELAKRLAEARASAPSEDALDAVLDEDGRADRASRGGRDSRGKTAAGLGRGRGWMGERVAERKSFAPPTPLEEVVGLILGSPEFQRR